MGEGIVIEVKARALVAGDTVGEVLRSFQRLSFWGGVDARNGRVIDRRHDRCGAALAGRVFVFPGEKGSSTGSAVLLELIRIGCAPAAVIGESDCPVLALGSIVADELYGQSIPILSVDAVALRALEEGARVEIRFDGRILVG